MTLSELCKGIDLQPALSKAVLDFAKDYNFSQADKLTEKYRDISKLGEVNDALRALVGQDKRNTKFLACCLSCACNLHEEYRKKCISDEIFFDTMKCFTRFSGESFERTGVLAFDRGWWTGRHLGLHIFRIGTLEYEMQYGEKPCINVHIPSDSVLEYNAIRASFEKAKAFFAEHFPEYKDCETVCTTWLFSPEVRERLSESSRIRIFGDFFDLTPTDSKSNSFTKWLFGVEDTGNYENLKEETSLQRSMKKFLLEGGKLTVTEGTLKKGYSKNV